MKLYNVRIVYHQTIDDDTQYWSDMDQTSFLTTAVFDSRDKAEQYIKDWQEKFQMVGEESTIYDDNCWIVELELNERPHEEYFTEWKADQEACHN